MLILLAMSEGKDVEMEVTNEKSETAPTDQTVTSAPKEDKDLLTVEGSTCIYLVTTTNVQWGYGLSKPRPETE